MSQEQNNTNSAPVSRRQWMKGAGALATGAALSQMSGLFMPKAHAEEKHSTKQWPWPYVKLDPQVTAELTYKEWYRIFCGGAVISSVVTQLAEKIGAPYTMVPVDAFLFLEGGICSWGTICGSNAGACIVANLIMGPRLVDKDAIGHRMSNDIMEFYCNASMPLFKPAEPRIQEPLPQTIAESPLCHVSVGKWMAIAEKPLNSPERKDRCARTAASVAYYLVELLNEWYDEEYEEVSEWDPNGEHYINAQPNCMECHGRGIPEAPRPQKS